MLLDVKEIICGYENTIIVDGCNFSIRKGDIACIVGPNGAGKSTLIKAALGLVKPLSGRVTFFGAPFHKMRHKIAYVPQKESVDWDFPVTVLDVALMGRYGHLGILKWVKKADKKAAMDALERLGIAHLANRQIRHLSGGQQQRLFIARSLLQDAEIYLLDEPFAGVDLMTERAIVSILKRLKNKGSTTSDVFQLILPIQTVQRLQQKCDVSSHAAAT